MGMLTPLADHLGLSLPRRAALALAGLVVCALPIVFAICGITGVGGPDAVRRLGTWVTFIGFAAAGAMCLSRSRAVELDRATWRWFAIACWCWTAANLVYALAYAPGPPPLPSVMDAGYVAFPVAIMLGLSCCARNRLRRIPADVWLDASVAALATAAVATAVMFAAVEVDTHHRARLITTLLFPVEDVLVLGALAGLGSLLGMRLGREWLLIALGIASITVADFVVFGRVLSASPSVGAWTNLGWTLGIALIAVGAWRRPEFAAASPAPVRRLTHAVPVAFAALALAVLTLDRALDLTPAASVLAAGALVLSFVRLYRSFQQVRSLADSRRLANTDDLTGLANRRRLLSDLDSICGVGAQRVLVLFDLDGFKRFNDTHGHPAGDELLRELAARLAAAVAPGARAYRLGGDEFCVLAAVDAGDELIAAAAAALAAGGPGWSVGASYGVVELPREAETTSNALRLADRRMYAQKDRRPAAARQQARDVLLSAMGEQQPDLHEHVRDVTGLAALVARGLGMPSDEIDDVVRAAELHDVGKLAVPREILDKPGPLDDAEWSVMRRHTIVGERMLRAAPALAAIAPLVRSSHERWDGAGYPDRLAGEEIPLGARIVAVCDSFDAMVTDRPYRIGMDARDALAELKRCSGTQFDPRVVDAFELALAASGQALIFG